MGTGTSVKRRRTTSAADSSANNPTPSRGKPVSGRGRGRPPNVPRDGRERPPSLAECFKRRCDEILDRLNKKDYYNIFLEPVNTDDVAGYSDIIKSPMDFTTMRNKLARQQYKSLGEFRKDLDLIWSNCLLFNGKEPTNVFSKKAIELRRLTEKLIVSTRQQLEKDKEALNQWKEKHRRRKESHAANAVAASIHPNHYPSALNFDALPNRTQGLAQPANNPPDSMDGLTDDFPPEEHTGRTPEQSALAESLRLQYAGASGLYKKSLQNMPFPQYTKPDGSVVDIPVTRYNPTDNHWDDPVAPVIETRHHRPQLICDALPSFDTPDASKPSRQLRPDNDIVFVDDYASSIFQFSKEINPAAQRVIVDLLSPELAVKVQQDTWKRDGYSLPELAKQAEAARSAPVRPDYRSQFSWTPDAIMKLADDIERANRRNLSILPKLPRAVTELDGMKILERFLDPKLVKEVDDVSLQVIDFAMPHGVNMQTLQCLAQLKRLKPLNLSEAEQASLDKLIKTGEEFMSRQTPEQRSHWIGASKCSSQQLDEMQAKAHSIRRHRRVEAERQAVVMAQCMAGSNMPPPSGAVPPSKRKRDPDLAATVHHQTRAASRQAAAHPAANPGIAKRPVEHAAMPPPQAHNRFPVQNNAVPNVSPAHARASPVRNGMNYPQQGKSIVIVCDNCGTSDSQSWNAGAARPNGVERLCLHCFLYLRKVGQPRPKELWHQPTGRRPPVSGNQHARPVVLSPSGLPNGQPMGSPLMRSPAGTPGVGTSSAVPSPQLSNGITKRKQRSARSSPTSRRSPSVLSASKKFADLQKLPAAIGMGAPSAPMVMGAPNVTTGMRGVPSMAGMHPAQLPASVGNVLAGRVSNVGQGVLPAPPRSIPNHTLLNPNPHPPSLPPRSLNAPILQQGVQMQGPGFSNGMYRGIAGNTPMSGAPNGDMTYPMGGNSMSMNVRQMALPKVTSTQQQAPQLPAQHNQAPPNLAAIRQSLAQRNLGGQGVFAARNPLMAGAGGGVGNGPGLSQAVMQGNQGLMGNMHAGNVQSVGMSGVPSGMPGIGALANASGAPDHTNLSFGLGGSVEKKVDNMVRSVGGGSQRFSSQGFDGAEMMGGLAGGDSMFMNNGNMNGVVAGSGNIDSNLFFYDGDLAPTSSGAPDLEF